MKRRFNINRISAFLLTLIMLLFLLLQGVGDTIFAQKTASQTAFGDEIPSKSTDAGTDSQENPIADDDQSIWQVGEAAYASFSAACEAADEGDTIRLLQDTTLAETLVVDRTVTMDLCGHVLNRGTAEAGDNTNNNVITVGTGGDLTIEDSVPTVIHSGSVTADGLWIWDTDGEITIAGGIITGGRAETTGGGIVVNGGGRLTMHGGTLAGNCSTAFSGGGLRVDLGSAELTGTDVCYNVAANGGGLYSTDILDVTGGSISYNIAASDAGGIGVWGGTTTLKNVTAKDNVSGNVSSAAVYVMNDNSRVNIKGASTQIEGAVTASTTSGDRIHLSNKLRWNGSMVETVPQELAERAGSMIAGGIATGRSIAEGMLAEGIATGRSIAEGMLAEGIATGRSIAEGIIMEGFTVRRTFVDGMLDDDAKSRSPVTALIRWNLWITKQAIASLQGAVRAAKDILPPLLSRLARWTSQLPRLPAQQKQLTIPLPRLPSVLPRLPSSPYFSHPLHFQQALDIIDI